MFSRLSNQVTLLEQLNAYTAQELETACENITFIIEALSLEAGQLISNRREHKVLVPHTDKSKVLSNVELDKLDLQQVLLEQSSLIQTINTLCLSEAIAIRNNFSDSLENIAEEKALSLPTVITDKNVKISTKQTVGKNNISPINLSQIKQRLAQATQESSDKQMKIKNKLNALLSQTKGEVVFNTQQA